MKDHLTPNHTTIELDTLYDVSKVLSSSLDLYQILNDVLKALGSQLQMYPAMVILHNDEGGLGVVAAAGLSREEMDRGRYQLGEGIVGKIMRAGTPVVVPDISQEPLFLNRAAGLDPSKQLHAFVGVPIKVGHETIGVLATYRTERRKGVSFGSDVRLLQMVANLIGQTVKLHQGVATERAQLLQEKFRLQKELQTRYSLDNVIGRSKRMQEVFADVHQAAPGRATILLRGESGTGKEVIARAIHYLSPRRDGPFVKLNCAALPESLLESELFGHEKGAFTGATQERRGRFELAHGGTLFLDEIGDVSLAFQAKLLRVLQEKEFERLGGTKTIKVDVRLITATNRNLENAVAKGEFRSDLYFRINVVSIFLPPLRERREDIPLLVDHFLGRFNQENRRKLVITPEAMQIMVDCYWPGNVRELENCVERTATMTRGNVIRQVDLPCQRGQCFSISLRHVSEGQSAIPLVAIPSQPAAAESPDNTPTEEAADDSPTSERDRLIWAMERCGWVQAKAARLLGLTPRQLGYALRKYQIELKRL
ncbi:MAG: nif-specific transcriptional activator NifA [Pseudomonadota bacterium]